MASRHVATGLAVLVFALFLVSAITAAETILLPETVPSFNQNYADGPGAWGDCPLGTAGCPDQIRTTGCLVTAFASVLGYYNIEVSVPSQFSCTGEARTGMDPGILNDWLRQNRGFGRCAQDPVGDCCLAWDRLPGGIELIYYSNRSDTGLNAVSAVVIDHALRGGRPVVAGVHWGASCRAGSEQTEDCHWVVLTGKAGETYTIVDPINFDSADPRGATTTLDAGTRGAYIIDRFVVVSHPSSESQPVPPVDDAPSSPDPADDDAMSGANAAFVLLAFLAVLVAVIALVSTEAD
jgi:hypothetical protein